MSDWAIGDLAVCVDAVGRITGKSVLVEGRTYTVSGIYLPSCPTSSDYGSPSDIGLWLEELRSPATSGAFDARRFRKVTPDKQESCEEEFVTLLRRSKPKVRA